MKMFLVMSALVMEVELIFEAIFFASKKAGTYSPIRRGGNVQIIILQFEIIDVIV